MTIKFSQTASVEDLQQQLAIARETNRQLHRRCQALESELARVRQQYEAPFKMINWEYMRAIASARRLRELLHETWKNRFWVFGLRKQYCDLITKLDQTIELLEAKIEERG